MKRLSQSPTFIESNPRFAVTSAARPNLHQGQMEILYAALEPYPSEYSLEEIVSRCANQHYAQTFKNKKTEIRKSILYQLDRLMNGTKMVPANSVRFIGFEK
jgi:hypothetical protein